MNEKKKKKKSARPFIYKPFIIPSMTIFRNDKVMIEQAYHLLAYSTEKVMFESESGTVQIIGENLLITLLYEEQMVIEGEIKELRFLPT